MKSTSKYKSIEISGILDKNELKNMEKVTQLYVNREMLSLHRKKTSNAKTGGILSVNQRNHLRLFLHKLQNTLAFSALQRHTEWIPYLYLSELLQRNAFSLFDKEFRKHYKHLRKNGHVLHCLLMKDLELERLIIEGIFTRQSVLKINAALEDMDTLVREYRQGFEWRTESYKVFLKNFHGALPLKPVKDLPKPSGTWQKIYVLRHRLHSAPGIDEKIGLLRQLYRLTSRQTDRLFKRETATTCSNLATYYMIQGKFERSLDYFNRALRLKKYFRPAHCFMLQFNYVGLSLRNMQFETAYAVMLQVDDNIQRLPAVAFKWKLLKCMCCVFAGKEKEIRNILPTTPEKKDASDYIYFYAIWAIYFTSIGKSETALQMIHTARSLSRRHQGDPGLLAFIGAAGKYHLYLHKYSPSTAAVKTRQILKNTDLKTLSAGNILPLIWFQKHLDKTV